jgi:superoxide dismutase, Fe-Mn family
MVTVGDIKKTILDSLEMTEPVIEEAYVAAPKEFDLTTELLSQKAKDAHKKLYHQYIDKLNRTSAQLDTVDRSAAGHTSAYRSLKASEVYNRNAVQLHELYFANISDVQSEVAYDSIAFMRLARDFGSFDDWQWDFIACALSAKNGWAVTAYDMFLRRYVNFFIDGHDCTVPIGCYPVIVMDMWEHSYFRDYIDDREKYVKNMMRELNWDVIERRVERSDALEKVLRL